MPQVPMRWDSTQIVSTCILCKFTNNQRSRHVLITLMTTLLVVVIPLFSELTRTQHGTLGKVITLARFELWLEITLSPVHAHFVLQSGKLLLKRFFVSPFDFNDSLLIFYHLLSSGGGQIGFNETPLLSNTVLPKLYFFFLNVLAFNDIQFLFMPILDFHFLNFGS